MSLLCSWQKREAFAWDRARFITWFSEIAKRTMFVTVRRWSHVNYMGEQTAKHRKVKQSKAMQNKAQQSITKHSKVEQIQTKITNVKKIRKFPKRVMNQREYLIGATRGSLLIFAGFGNGPGQIDFGPIPNSTMRICWWMYRLLILRLSHGEPIN